MLIATSACLLGDAVRYDGGDKRNELLLQQAQGRVEFMALCPEADAGLGVPREPMRLEGDPQAPHLITIDSRRDKTAVLARWCEMAIVQIKQRRPSGIILKKRSPSCGIDSVAIITAPNSVSRGAGLFAASIKAAFPDIPMIEGDDLESVAAIEAFFTKAATYAATKASTTGNSHGQDNRR